VAGGEARTGLGISAVEATGGAGVDDVDALSRGGGVVIDHLTRVGLGLLGNEVADEGHLDKHLLVESGGEGHRRRSLGSLRGGRIASSLPTGKTTIENANILGTKDVKGPPHAIKQKKKRSFRS